jgi:hypothetical protein
MDISKSNSSDLEKAIAAEPRVALASNGTHHAHARPQKEGRPPLPPSANLRHSLHNHNGGSARMHLVPPNAGSVPFKTVALQVEDYASQVHREGGTIYQSGPIYVTGSFYNLSLQSTNYSLQTSLQSTNYSLQTRLQTTNLSLQSTVCSLQSANLSLETGLLSV